MIAMAMPASTAMGEKSAGSKMTFTKYLILDEGVSVPSVTFNFTIESVTVDNDPTENGFPVHSGITAESGKPSVSPVSFSSDDTPNNSKNPDLGLQDDQVSVDKEVTVDFSDLVFNEVGIFRYLLKESAEDLPDGVTADPDSYIVDVYVGYDTSGSLSPLKYVMYMYKSGNSAENKVTNIQNQYTTYDLTLTKVVEGNQANPRELFSFTVKIEGNAGTTYNVAVANSSTDQGATNPASMQIESGKASVEGTFTLKSGQSIVIYGLTKDTKYTITESSNDYTTSWNITGDSSTSSTSGTDLKTTGEQQMGGSDTTVAFTNTKNGTIPTGLLLEVAPYALLVVVIAGGLVALTLTSRKQRNR